MSQVRTPSAGERSGEAVASAGRVARQWLEVVVQSVKDLIVDSGTQRAAAVAYYTLLSAVPLFLVVVSIASAFVDPQWAVDRVTSMLGDFVPEEGTIEEIVNNAIAARGRIGLLAFVGLLITGTRVFDALTSALNVAFNVDDDYTILQRWFIQVVMLLTLGTFFVFALLSGPLMRTAWDIARFLPGERGAAAQLLEWLIQVALLLAALVLLYRFVPRGGSTWRSALVGAAAATFLLAVTTPIFSAFVDRFGTYNLIYGSLGILVVIVVWVGIAANIVIFGGEVASHTQEMVFEGRPTAAVAREHQQRSPGRRPIEPGLEVPERGLGGS
jgi:membrane protein